MNIEQDLTAVVVVYNTPRLISECIAAFRWHYGIKIVLVDNSPPGSICAITCESLAGKFKNIKLVKPGRNIGHGPGLNAGLKHVSTPYALIMDSDTAILNDFLPDMLRAAKSAYYGAGMIVHVDHNGFNCEKGTPYLHPHFAIIKMDQYKYWVKFRNCGAPLLDTMKALNRLKIDKPILVDYNLAGKIIHHERGTVNVLINEKQA